LFPAGAGFVVSGASSSSWVSEDGVPLALVPDEGAVVVVAGGFMVSAGVRSVLGAEVDFVLSVAGAGSGPTIFAVGVEVLAVVDGVDVLEDPADVDDDVVVDGVLVVVEGVLVVVEGVLVVVEGVLVLDVADFVDDAVVLDEVGDVVVVAGELVGMVSVAGGFNVGFLVPVIVMLVVVGAGSGPIGFWFPAVVGVSECVDSGVASDVSVPFTGVPSGGTGRGAGLMDVLSGLVGVTGISLGT